MTTTAIITGSGCPIPDAHRAGPGVLVRSDGLDLQFDAGRSTVQRLAGAGLWPVDLDAVFVTHHHSDHLTGMQDLVLTRWVMRRDQQIPTLPIVAPNGPATVFLNGMLACWRDDIDVRKQHARRTDDPDIDVVGFDVPTSPAEVWRRGDIVVSAGRVRHEPVHPAVGYRVDTPDGSIAISGDTVVCDEMAELAAGVDVLVYEAMRFSIIERLPEHRRFVLDYHADARLIGAQARDLGVPTLVLTHLIPPPETAEQRDGFVAEVRAAGFEGELVVADDLDAVTLGA
jgi:ribonuclease Z